MIRCHDESLYTGITTDVARRFKQHQSGVGAKYFRAHKPEQVVYQEMGHDRSSASKREAEIKKLSPVAKRRMIISSVTIQRAELAIPISRDA
ncbi:MAG: GIY-YIG nuclease family protein [Deltaproteobacteria bacterium]|nr:GIY-YIG nuclease family protein [Deltaproteobacteria bacterium]